VSGQQVNKLLLWNGKNIWWACQQEVALSYIQHQEINSVLTAYGTSGAAVYPLFAQPSTGFSKTAQTKLWDAPGGYQLLKWVNRLWGIVKFYSALAANISVSIDNETSSIANTISVASNIATWITPSGALSTWTTPAGAVSTWTAGGGSAFSVLAPEAVAGQGVLIGFTLTTNAADMTLVTMMIQANIAAYRG
jgi:hypothetical protein